MKFLIVGDLHITTSFGSRKDNVFLKFCEKVGQILETAHMFGCEAILQAGDFFDSHKANDFLKQHFIKIFKARNIPIYTVFGQHDLRYHSSNTENTPLQVLSSSGVVQILQRYPITYPVDNDTVMIFGSSWNESLPEIEDFGEVKSKKILVLHKMIVDEKIWKGQEDHVYAPMFLKKHREFDLIVSGDNHKTFTAQSGKRFLINAGSLMRTRIDQEDHKPCVFLYDTLNPKIERIDLIIEPFEDVIKVEEAKKQKKENETLQKFVDALSKDTQLTGINYRKNIKTYLDSNLEEFDSDTLQFINEVLANVEA